MNVLCFFMKMQSLRLEGKRRIFYEKDDCKSFIIIRKLFRENNEKPLDIVFKEAFVKRFFHVFCKKTVKFFGFILKMWLTGFASCDRM